MRVAWNCHAREVDQLAVVLIFDEEMWCLAKQRSFFYNDAQIVVRRGTFLNPPANEPAPATPLLILNLLQIAPKFDMC